MIVPAGAKHNVVNTGSELLRIYTIYEPPEHLNGTVHRTKAKPELGHHECRVVGRQNARDVDAMPVKRADGDWMPEGNCFPNMGGG